MITFWNTIDTIPCDSDAPDKECRFRTGQEVLNFYGMTDQTVVVDCIILIAINLGFRCIAALGLSCYIRNNT